MMIMFLYTLLNLISGTVSQKYRIMTYLKFLKVKKSFTKINIFVRWKYLVEIFANKIFLVHRKQFVEGVPNATASNSQDVDNLSANLRHTTN